MRRLILAITMAVVVCLGGICLGQEQKGTAKEAPPNQEQLKSMAYFLGVWELTGEINLAGQPKVIFVFERQFKWDLGNNFIQTTTTETKDGKTELRHRSMIGWEAKTQRITEWGFWNPGSTGKLSAWAETVTWAKDDGKWRIEREGVKGLFTIVDQNTHKYECTFRGDDGSNNSWHYTATRKARIPVAKAEQTPLPDNIVKELNYFVGNWLLEAQGVKPSSWSFRWAAGKHCLLVEYRREEAGKVILGNGILGWDSVSGETAYLGMYADPAVEHLHAKLEKPGVFKGSYSLSLEGKKTDAAWELRREGQDQYTIKITGMADAHFKRVKHASAR